MIHHIRKSTVALASTGLLCALGIASPVMAMTQPATRLVSCRSESCLLISGHRGNSMSTILINGHEVAVEGGRRWHVRLPVKTVRSWSGLYARTVEIDTVNPRTGTSSTEANLPIGLLGNITKLASLIIRLN